jgi:hypothetical protein
VRAAIARKDLIGGVLVPPIVNLGGDTREDLVRRFEMAATWTGNEHRWAAIENARRQMFSQSTRLARGKLGQHVVVVAP